MCVCVCVCVHNAKLFLSCTSANKSVKLKHGGENMCQVEYESAEP